LFAIQQAETQLNAMKNQLLINLQGLVNMPNPDPVADAQRQQQIVKLKQDLEITQTELQKCQLYKQQLQQANMSHPMGKGGNFHGNNLNLMHQNSATSQSSNNHGFNQRGF